MAKKVDVKVVSHKDEVLAEFKHMKAVALEAIGTQAEGNVVLEIQAMDAIDTGNLLGSIDHMTDEDSAYVGTDVGYGYWVHVGTSKMEPRPFLEKGITEFVDEYREIVENYMTKN